MNKSLYALALLAFLGSSLLATTPCFSQSVDVSNVSFALQDSNVVIHYDLAGPRNKAYKVTVLLRRKGDPGFKFMPADVSGDVGKGDFAGTDRRVVWHMFKEIPDGLYGNDYYFEVTATLIGGGGGISWLYYVSGAIVAGGAAAAVIYKSQSSNKNGTTTLPQPPGRPY